MKITPLKKNLIVKEYIKKEEPLSYKLYKVKDDNNYFEVVTVGAECTSNINPGDVIMINSMTILKLDDEDFKGLYLTNSDYVDAIVQEE